MGNKIAMPRTRHTGFTLIELLTVIAIIAILTAIIFPVFAKVQENARQATSLSNLHQISTAMAQFQLDNHKYPDVLFGYVYSNAASGVIPMDKALAQAQTDFNGGNLNANPKYFFPGLYPEYIKDANAFADANNSIKDLTAVTKPVDVNLLAPCDAASDLALGGTAACPGTGGTLVPSKRNFYAADAYDTSPEIDSTNTNALVANTYIPRYQSSWTNVDNTFDCDYTPAPSAGIALGLCNAGSDGSPRNDYLREMRWKNPPANAYVTSTTYHVPNANTILVLWESGTAKKYDPSQFLATGASAATQNDVASIAAVNGVSQANFWKTPLNK